MSKPIPRMHIRYTCDECKYETSLKKDIILHKKQNKHSYHIRDSSQDFAKLSEVIMQAARKKRGF